MRSTAHALIVAHRRLLSTSTATLCAVACLALGIGASTAIYSAVSVALLRALPFREPNRLIAIHRTSPQSGPNGAWSQSPANFHDIAARATRVRDIAAITWSSAVVGLSSSPVQASAFRVTANFFQTLGARPALGRLLQPADDELRSPVVAVVSNEFWRRSLGADPAIVGRLVPIDGAPTTIVGVLPRDFRVPVGGIVFRADVWKPMRFTPQQAAGRNNNYLRLLGRLTPDATMETAALDLRAVFDNMVIEHPDLRGDGLRIAPMGEETARAVRTPLLLLLGAVLMVLLIASTNVTAILLARGVQRRRELAVRIAIGATTRDIMAVAFGDTLVLAGWGVALGTLISVVGVRTIGTMAGQQLPQLQGLSIDLRVLAFAIALGAVTAALCGAMPAWRSAHTDPQDALRAGRVGGGRERHRAFRTLVVGEIAVSLVLLLGAGLALRGFSRLIESDPGFDATKILSVRVNASSVRYSSDDLVPRFIEPTLAAMGSHATVEAAAVISCVPYQCWANNSSIRFEGRPAVNPAQLPIVEQRQVTPGFFDVTHQRLISGRVLRPTDVERSPQVAVVNEALVKREFNGNNPVGHRYRTSDTTWGTIVGVVSNIKNNGPVQPPAPEMYTTLRQSGGASGALDFMIRVRGANPMGGVAAVRAAVQSVDPTAALSNPQSMTEVISDSIGGPRFYLTLLGVFAVIGVVLAAAGLFGVLSYVVAQRTRELGIRSALGATRARIAELIVRDALRLSATGIMLGLLGAAAATRLMISMLYGVSPLDTITWVSAAGLMVVIGLAAALMPVYRASLADPLRAIKEE